MNVVSKMKDIGQTAILKRGNAPADKTVEAMADRLTVLDEHFDETWDELEVKRECSLR